MTKNSLKTGPDELGYYGHGESAMGGMAVGETLMPALHELNQGFEEAIKDKEFLDEFAYYCKHYIGRPSPLYFAENLTKELGGARILFKQEHLNHTGSHKITNSLFQVLLAKRMGKSHLICESGAGQHYSATAAVAAKFNMPLVGVMGDIDVARVNQNIIKAKHYGAKLKTVPGTLKEAITDAIKTWTTNPDFAYICGSVVSSHPFPKIVAFAQSIIGREIREQSLEQEGKLPDMIVGCVGGGSNAAGLYYHYLEDEKVKIISVEAAGEGVESGKSAATSVLGKTGIIHGSKTLLMQTKDGQIVEPYSISAGLDYPGVGPEHSFLKDTKRARYTLASDKEALNAFKLVSKLENLRPSLEPAHAWSECIRIAPKLKKSDVIVVNNCGKGYKDKKIYIENIGYYPE